MNKVYPINFGTDPRLRAAVGKHPRPWHLSAKRDAIEDTRGHTIIAADDYPTDPALLEAICEAINQLYPGS
ncbi:hypothetical protein [Methylobacterium nigriterrae]|uniref:hypothetical protein n=1 Tax=Methylobacterium nigriterrae TaxID=3127512 RepID=UPI00301392D6